MASVVSVCNLALGRVRAGSINSIDETSPSAQACNLFYEPSLRRVLRSSDWICARTRVALAQKTNDRATEWLYAYQIPSGVARILSVPFIPDAAVARWWLETPGEYGIMAPWAHQNIKDVPTHARLLGPTTLYTDVTPAYLEYVPSTLDPSRFSDQFENALVAELAASICYKITGDAALTKIVKEEAIAIRAQSVADDGNMDEDTINFIPPAILARN